jgi:uncharacterized protein YfaS (alpha-2-macroglobulin family)
MKTLLKIVVLLLVATAFGYSFSNEVPVGRVTGKVLLPETGKPFQGARVVLTPDTSLTVEDDENAPASSPPQRVWRTKTDDDGEFLLKNIPEGFYRATAYTRAHRVNDQLVFIEEDKTASATLKLRRSQPDLQLTQQQKVFLAREPAFLPVHGYLDGKLPPSQNNLRIRIFKARLSAVLRDEKSAAALQRVGDRWQSSSTLPRALMQPAGGSTPRLVAERSEKITGADTEGFFHQRVPLRVSQPGLYLAEIRHGARSVCGWVQISDTGLVIKRSPSNLLTYTVDMQSGAPRKASRVVVYRGGKQISQGVSDARGLAQFALPPNKGQESQLMVVAMRGGDEDAVNSYDYDEEDDGAFTTYTYTDRPIYRPGDRIQYKTIIRRAIERGVKYSVPVNEPVTVELRDASGERVLRETRAVNRFGSISGFVALSKEAPTGVYTFVTTVRGEEHSQDVTIASYRKPEFSATITPEKKRYNLGEKGTMIVSGEYYFGAPVAGAKVSYQIFRETDWAAEYPDDYGYDEWDEEAAGEGEYDYGGYGETVSDGEATLDETGKALIEFPTVVPRENSSESESDGTPQAQIFKMHVTMTDAAGRAVEADGTTRVTMGDVRLSVSPEGYVATPQKPTRVTITAKDYDGKPVANREVKLESGYWRWDTERDESKYAPVSMRRAVTDANGKAIVEVTPPRSGELRLNAIALDNSGRTVRARAYLWAASESGDYGSEYPDLAILTDKRRYEAGDTAQVLLNSESVGQTALLTVEGARVYRSWTVPLKAKSTFVRVPVLADYGPNVFLSACYVRDKKFARSEIPLRVHAPQREIKVAVKYDRYKHQPGTPAAFEIKTTDAKGRAVPCDLSFGVVDESIYALREDRPLALRDTFYPRRANMVNTSFSFEPQYLGDADKGEAHIEARRKFLDTAFWQPNVQTDSSGHATVAFDLPDNLTTWRATAVAQSSASAFGREISKILVSKDFFVRLEAPRFLTQNDQSRLTAFIHNETNEEQTATVRLAASGLKLGGQSTQVLSIKPGEIAQATWPVAAQNMGEAKLRLTAWTGSASTPLLSDGVETSLPVRARGRERFTDKAGEVTSRRIQSASVYLDKNAIADSQRLTIRVTPSPFNALQKALEYLLGYPYGCVEQTLSRFLPDILFQRMMRLGKLQGSSSRKQKELPLMVRDGLTRLTRMQHEDGGWGWWETDDSDANMTAYVLYGLSLARDEGYAVSPEVLARGRRAAAQMATKARGREKVFLLYALALAGDVKTAKIQRAKISLTASDPKDVLDSQAMAWLVLLDKKIGLQTTDSFDALMARIQDDSLLAHWETRETQWGELWDNRTATATGLQALLAHDANDARIGKALRWLMLQRTDDFWEDTLDTSFVIAALCDYFQARPQETRTSGEVLVRMNGKPLQTIKLESSWKESSDFVLRVPFGQIQTGKNTIDFERRGGESPTFYTVQLRQTIAEEELAPIEIGGLKVKREYLRIEPRKSGESRWNLHAESTNNRMKQGDSIRVRLTVIAPRDMNYVLIEDPFPSGCETTERGEAEATPSEGDWNYWWSSTDVRDDRIAFFARTLSKGKHVVEYNLRAQTSGTYRVLPTFVEPMYAPAARAESGDAEVTVQ